MPINLGLTLLFLAVLLRWRQSAPRLARWALRLGIAVLLVFSVPVTSQLLAWPLERAYARPTEPPKTPVAIVMLTGMLHLNKEGSTSYDFSEAADRFVEMLRLAHRYPKAKILILGGSSSLAEDASSEGRVLGRLATELGVASARLLVDAASRNTRENAVNGAKLLATLPPGEVILVTSGYHLPRAMACFAKVDLAKKHFVAWPVDNGDVPLGAESFIPRAYGLEFASRVVNEYVGLVVYWVLGYV